MVICLCRLLQGDVQIWKNGGLKPIMMRSLSPHFSSVWLFAGAYLSSSQKKAPSNALMTDTVEFIEKIFH